MQFQYPGFCDVLKLERLIHLPEGSWVGSWRIRMQTVMVSTLTLYFENRCLASLGYYKGSCQRYRKAYWCHRLWTLAGSNISGACVLEMCAALLLVNFLLRAALS